MATTPNIPTTDAGFDEKQRLVVDQAQLNATKWKLDTVFMATEVLPAQAVWTNRYEEWQHLDRRTPIVTKQKNDAKESFLVVFRQLVAQLLSSSLITEQELDAMKLQRPSHKHPHVPVPESNPTVKKVDLNSSRRVTLYFIDSKTGGRAKPHGVGGAVVRYGVLPEPPKDLSELIHTVLDSVSPCHLDFSESQRGSFVYYCLAWQNERGEKGPWSAIEHSIIP
jgi:hypothetical protein